MWKVSTKRFAHLNQNRIIKAIETGSTESHIEMNNEHMKQVFNLSFSDFSDFLPFLLSYKQLAQQQIYHC